MVKLDDLLRMYQKKRFREFFRIQYEIIFFLVHTTNKCNVILNGNHEEVPSLVNVS